MDSNRANRHRLGVILFCLIALLTAREDWDFRTPHPISPPIPRNTAPRRALELASIPPTRPLLFDPDRNPMHGNLLRPLCPSNGSADLAACDFISEQTPWEIAALYQPEPGSAINPDMFPQALEFIPEAKLPVKEETIARELLQHVAEVQYPIAIANDPVGWWREPHPKVFHTRELRSEWRGVLLARIRAGENTRAWQLGAGVDRGGGGCSEVFPPGLKPEIFLGS